MTTTTLSTRLQDIPMKRIIPDPWQPRTDFEPVALAELRDSIEANGLLQPITVQHAGGRREQYTIVSGERRYRAVELLEWETIPALVMLDELPGMQLRVLQLMENLARKDLNPVEEGRACKNLMDHGYSAGDVAYQVGRPQAHVTMMVGVLDAHDDVQHLVVQGTIQPRLAAAMGKLDVNQQGQVLHRMTTEKLDSVTAVMACRALVEQKQQSVMFEPELDEEEVAAVRDYRSTFEAICLKVNTLLEKEAKRPGALARAMGENAKAEDEKLGMLIGSLQKVRWTLRREQAKAQEATVE